MFTADCLPVIEAQDVASFRNTFLLPHVLHSIFVESTLSRMSEENPALAGHLVGLATAADSVDYLSILERCLLSYAALSFAGERCCNAAERGYSLPRISTEHVEGVFSAYITGERSVSQETLRGMQLMAGSNTGLVILLEIADQNRLLAEHLQARSRQLSSWMYFQLAEQGRKDGVPLGMPLQRIVN